MPMFSIIIPSYNRQAEISALLQHLARQTVKNFEVIIVDDCSTHAVVIHQKYAFPVRVIRNQVNQGAAASRNIGVANAQFEWLLFLDDDDCFDVAKCAHLAQAISQNKQVNFIYHPAKCIMVNEGFSYLTKPAKPENLTLDNMLLANKVGGMPMMAIKKDFFIQLGGLAPDLKSLEDYEFVLKLVTNQHLKALLLEQPMTICTFHTKRASVSTNMQNTVVALQAIRQKYVKTADQAAHFELNALYILSYPYIMNLSRQAAKNYFAMFKRSHHFKHLLIAVVTFISPKLAINMKRFS